MIEMRDHAPPELSRAFKAASDRLQTLMFQCDMSGMDKDERKAHRQNLARARFDMEMAQIELDASWTPHDAWFSPTSPST